MTREKLQEVAEKLPKYARVPIWERNGAKVVLYKAGDSKGNDPGIRLAVENDGMFKPIVLTTERIKLLKEIFSNRELVSKLEKVAEEIEAMRGKSTGRPSYVKLEGISL